MSVQEFSWLRFRPCDFFPSKRAAWEEMKNIVVGTQVGTLSEALFLTTLPARLKSKYPTLKVHTFAGGFNPIVFKGNPFVDGVKFFPKEIFGDGIRRGDQHLIQIKEKFFGLEQSTDPRPELYLTLEETSECKKFLNEKLLSCNENKPLCLIHVKGSQPGFVAPIDFWDAIVNKWSHRYRFWQVGVQNDPAVKGCEFYFLPRPTQRSARKLFALMSQADAFIGVDASPMHIASAFRVPSLVFFKEVPTDLSHRYYISGQHHYKKVGLDLEALDEFLGNRFKLEKVQGTPNV